MLFNDTSLRDAFVEMHGTDKEGAEFKIGDKVIFNTILPLNRPMMWIGRVLAINCTGEGFEYLVENAHVLAWEHELSRPKEGNA